jgi:hypothetical protein
MERFANPVSEIFPRSLAETADCLPSDNTPYPTRCLNVQFETMFHLNPMEDLIVK